MAKISKWSIAALLVCLLAGVFATQAMAQALPLAAPTSHIEVGQLPPPGVDSFDPHKAVNAYLSRVSGAARARSNAYFEGGYILNLIDTLYAVVVAGVLLWFRISAMMRNIATEISEHRVMGVRLFRYLRTPIYIVQYFLVTTLLALPLTVYEKFTREHAYGLSNQTLMQWAHDYGIETLVSLVGFTVLVTVIYALIRVAKKSWWIWGTVVSVVFLAFGAMIGPVYIAPLTNHYTSLPDSGLKSTILSMARANGIPAKDVYVFDASRQSNRISANVSGFLGTTRISLTDNLLNDCTPSEVLAVLGHEMGHYVMDHIVVLLTWFGILFLVGFWFLDRAFRGLANLLGGNWDIRTMDDPAGLPLFVALFSVFMLVATPVTNTMTRTLEVQADIFGLNAVRQPDAFATVALKLANYRKLDPTPLEEFVFYDHPSGRTRIWEAMRWKAEHIHDPDIMSGPMSPQ